MDDLLNMGALKKKEEERLSSCISCYASSKSIKNGDYPLSIRPITPSPDRESNMCHHNILTSDAVETVLSQSSTSQTETTTSLSNNEEGDSLLDVDDDSSPHTPKEVVFDPFAPGPDHMALAPNQHRIGFAKPRKEFQDICRRLSFEGISSYSDDDEEEEAVRVDIVDVKEEELSNVEEMSDELSLECLYESLLETIFMLEKEEGGGGVGVVAEKNQCDDINDYPENSCLQTPPCTISGVGEDSLFDNSDEHICPGAPMKRAVRKSINLESVRRRLEF